MLPTVLYAELATATQQFDPSFIVGSGGFGPVYSGELHGQSVLIKKLIAADAIADFQRDVKLLTACQHENIVPLVAFSMEPSEPLCLVFLFMSGGALSDALRSADRRASLGAVARLRIAADVASGLRYLHANESVKPSVVHRGVRSANILLDADSRARLAEFGLARDFGDSTNMTLGYDPEYNETFELTARSDVFSFGVVLLELLTSAPAVDTTLRPPTLSARLRHRLPDDTADVADAAAFGDASEFATRLAALAVRSIEPTSNARPTAAELAEALDSLHAEALDASRPCVVCLDRPYATRLYPCLHSVVCEECASALLSCAEPACPLCRSPLARFETGTFDSTFDSTYVPPLPSFPHARDAASLGDFSELVELLRNGAADCKKHTARAFWNLAQDNATNKAAIARAGAVAPLVALLRSDSADCKEHAVRAVANLAAGNAGNKVSIAAAGAVAPIAELLRTGTADCKEHAARACANLAAGNAANKISIAAAGAIAPLVELVRNGTAGCKEAAAAALQNLAAAGNVANQDSIASAGGVAPIIELVRSGTTGCKEQAAAALANLAANNIANKAAIAAAGAVAPLVALLRNDSSLCKEHAALALAIFAAGNTNNKISIAAAGAVTLLVELLRSGTAGCKQRAALALNHLAGDNAANKVSIIAAGAVELLVELERSGTTGCKTTAAMALATLAPTRLLWRWPLPSRSSSSR